MTDAKVVPQLGRRLAKFFGQAAPLLRRKSGEDVVDTQLDARRLGSFIGKLRAPLGVAEAWACANPWGAAGLGRDEVRVSAVLASLWDRRRYGDEARAFLARFFAEAGSAFPREAELADGYRVQTEHCLNGAASDRIDITVETRSSIVGIEVKIHAPEGRDQLSRYVAAIETRARLMQRTRHKVIFLAPYSSKGTADGIAQLGWRAVADAAAKADDDTQAGWLIRQFGEHCRSFGAE